MPTGAGSGTAVAAAPPVRQQPVRVGGDQALVRSVEMSLGSRQPVRKSGRLVADNVDPSIPLDRVPHFQKDLVRLGIVAAVMVVLLVAGAQLIPLLVK